MWSVERGTAMGKACFVRYCQYTRMSIYLSKIMINSSTRRLMQGISKLNSSNSPLNSNNVCEIFMKHNKNSQNANVLPKHGRRCNKCARACRASSPVLPPLLGQMGFNNENRHR